MAPPFQSESDLNKFLDSLKEESKNSKGDLDRRVSENLDQVRGKQWKGKSAPVFAYNVIESSLEDKNGKLSETKPEIMVMPSSNGLGPAAELLTQVVSSIWDRSKLEYKTERVALIGAICGVAFIGTPFNRRLANGMGDIDVIVKDPRCCGIDMAVTAAEDADLGEYAICEDYVPLDLIRAEFPGRGALVKRNDRVSGYDVSQPQTTVAKLRGAYSRLVQGNKPEKQSAIPKAVIEEFYVQDRRKSIEDDGVVPIVENITKCADDGIPFPGGRRILRAGEIILEDDLNPYWDAKYPLDMMSWKLDMESAWGPDEIQSVKRMQELILRLGDAYGKTALMNAVSRIIMDTNALSPVERNKLSNEVGQIIEKAPGRTFEYQVPPVLPADTINFVNTLMGWIREKIGVTQAPTQKRVPSIITGPAIEGLQMMIETPIRTSARRIEEFYQRIGQKLISRIFQFYTSDRLLHMVGPEQKWIKFEFKRLKILQDANGKSRSPEDLRKAAQDFYFTIAPGSSLAIARTQRAMMKFQLASVGWLHPREVLTELGIMNPEEKLKDAAKAKGDGLFDAVLGKGGGMPTSSGNMGGGQMAA